MNKKINKLFLLGAVALLVTGCQPKQSKHNYGELIKEVPATCTQDGFKAHYECQDEGCGKYFDVDKNEVSKESLVIEKLGHSTNGTWFEEDGYHYHICERCSQRFDINVHSLRQVDAHDPDHVHEGNISHYECDVCNKNFIDSQGLVEVAHIHTSPLGHDLVLTHHDAVSATCEAEGTKEYYSCSCGALFEDAEGTKSIENPVKIPALGHIHNEIWKTNGLKHWHTCFRCGEVIDEHEHTPGNETHQDLEHTWKLCTVCHEKCNIQDRVISGCHHNRLMHFEKLSPTFTDPGHIEYWFCFDCGKSYYDAACTREIENTQYGVADKRDDRYILPLPKTISLLNQNLKDYLDAEREEDIIAALANTSVYNDQAKNIAIWQDTLKLPYQIEISKTRDFTEFESHQTNLNVYTFEGTLTPGETIYYRVKDASGEYIVDDLSVYVSDDYSLRTLRIDGVSNVRDLGGWTAKDGKKVQYGKIYRGGELKAIKGSGREQFLGSLGMKTEIDLRADSPEQVISDSRLNYQNLGIWMYTSIIPDLEIRYPTTTASFAAYSVPSLKSIFEILADESNYPVYYHCAAGADRTGTLSYLINGLLGVSYEDLTKDFELTSFSVFGARYRSTPTNQNTFDNTGYFVNEGNWVAGWGKLNDAMVALYGEDDKPLYFAIENYLKEVCELSDETIASVRRNLLGEDVDFSI